MQRTVIRAGRPLIALIISTVLAIASTQAMAQMRIRKSIDSLSAQELRDYIHAFRKLIEISEANPDSTSGYSYFEALHDDLDVGPCEHGRDTFLPWHRAHLHLFEDALRRSDPPRTSNVTLPYWDWSELPSGSRFPAIFEMEKLSGPAFAGTELDGVANPLFHAGRASGAICKPGSAPGSCVKLPYPRTWVESKLLNIKDWAGVGAAGFGGKSSGESSCDHFLDSGFGQPEGTAHNTMHNSFIAGDMANPSRASLDPMFWSFHAYFDLLWSQWQDKEGHKTDTCLTCKLCGLFRDAAQTDRFTVQNVLKTDTDLSYKYEYNPPAVIMAAAPTPTAALASAAPFEPHPAVDFALSATRVPDLVRTFDVEIPRAPFQNAALTITGLKHNDRFTYEVDVYLHPKNEPFRPMDATFRQRYLVELFTLWRAHRGGHGAGANVVGTMDWPVDLTPQLKALAGQHAGETWTATVALVRRPSEPAKFTPPAASPAAAPAPPGAGLMGLDSLNLSVR